MGDIYLKNKIVSNLSLSDDVIGVYVALRKMYLRDKSKYYISINGILFELFDSFNYKRQDYINISDGLTYLQNNEMEEDKHIEFTYFMDGKNKKSKKEFIVDLSVLDIDKSNNDEDYYTVITADELSFIMNYGKSGKNNESQINNFALLRYFVFLISTINFNEGIYIDGIGNIYNNFVGYQSHKYLSGCVGIAENTLIKFNKILEDNEIIYCKRNNQNRITLSGDFRSLRNHYGRFKDKENIDKFNEQYLIKVGLEEPIAKKQSKRNQSLANKYYWMTQGKEYDDINMVKEIYYYIHKCNMELQEEIDSKNKQLSLSDTEKDYVKKLENNLRDESVFEKYDLLKTEVHNDAALNELDDDISDSIDYTNNVLKDMFEEEEVKVDMNPFHDNSSGDDKEIDITSIGNKKDDNERLPWEEESDDWFEDLISSF